MLPVVATPPFPLSDHTNLFAQLIARTAKDIELLIDSLPSEESSLQLQEASLIELEKHNSEAAQKLEDVVKQGEAIRQEIQGGNSIDFKNLGTTLGPILGPFF